MGKAKLIQAWMRQQMGREVKQTFSVVESEAPIYQEATSLPL